MACLHACYHHTHQKESWDHSKHGLPAPHRQSEKNFWWKRSCYSIPPSCSSPPRIFFVFLLFFCNLLHRLSRINANNANDNDDAVLEFAVTQVLVVVYATA